MERDLTKYTKSQLYKLVKEHIKPYKIAISKLNKKELINLIGKFNINVTIEPKKRKIKKSKTVEKEKTEAEKQKEKLLKSIKLVTFERTDPRLLKLLQV